MTRFRHIAIEGVIGAGKTSLARKLGAFLGAELLLEQPGDNPYLERFYDDPAGYAFQTQVFFLFQRLRQVAGLAQPGMFSPAIVSDFMFAKDALFARMNLGDDEYRLYRQMYDPIEARVPQPDLVIWLQAPVPTLMQRIRRRGIAMEQRIDEAYLLSLTDAYAAFFHGFEAAPVLVVQTEHFNPIDRESDFQALVDKLGTVGHGRAFLGPGSDTKLA